MAGLLSRQPFVVVPYFVLKLRHGFPLHFLIRQHHQPMPYKAGFGMVRGFQELLTSEKREETWKAMTLDGLPSQPQTKPVG